MTWNVNRNWCDCYLTGKQMMIYSVIGVFNWISATRCSVMVLYATIFQYTVKVFKIEGNKKLKLSVSQNKCGKGWETIRVFKKRLSLYCVFRKCSNKLWSNYDQDWYFAAEWGLYPRDGIKNYSGSCSKISKNWMYCKRLRDLRVTQMTMKNGDPVYSRKVT